jgi:hypothetical protein
VLLTRFRRNFGLLAALLFMFFSSSACLVRTRTVTPRGQPPDKPILSATKEELLERIHRVADPIQSFSLKVDMSPSVGAVFGGKVTDYPTIHGFILFRRPDRIRVIGLDPVVHSTILDMVSLGNDYRVSIPTKNPPAPGEYALLEDVSDESRAVYKLIFLERDGDEIRELRSVYFDRFTLDISRQRTFDRSSHVTSETKYSNWSAQGGVRFPLSIDMERPLDGYALQLQVTEFKLNPADLTDEKFVLNPPPNAEIRRLPR